MQNGEGVGAGAEARDAGPALGWHSSASEARAPPKISASIRAVAVQSSGGIDSHASRSDRRHRGRTYYRDPAAG